MYGFAENGAPEMNEQEIRDDSSEEDMESDNETGSGKVTNSDYELDSDIEACLFRNSLIVTDFICRKLI